MTINDLIYSLSENFTVNFKAEVHERNKIIYQGNLGDLSRRLQLCQRKIINQQVPYYLNNDVMIINVL